MASHEGRKYKLVIYIYIRIKQLRGGLMILGIRVVMQSSLVFLVVVQTKRVYVTSRTYAVIPSGDATRHVA